MRVQLMCRKSIYRGKTWTANPLDAFWVEANLREALSSIFPYLTLEQQQKSREYAEKQPYPDWKREQHAGRYCFLVARDLSTIDPFPPLYPHSNQWNGYNPFHEIPERKITSLTELKLIAKEYRYKPRKCPVCGSNRIANILYGLPVMSPKMERELATGKLVLGGCCITDDDPEWQCADCNCPFFKQPGREIPF